LTGDIANDFFPWKNPEYLPDDFAFWIVAAITSIASLGILAPESVALALGLEVTDIAVIATSAGAFASAAVQQITESLRPDLTPSQGLAQLGAFGTTVGSDTRTTIEQWANTTFRGHSDAAGKDLRDYLRGGSYAGPIFPSNQEIETFFKDQMVSRIINSAWNSNNVKVFIMFANTTDSSDSHGPSYAKYYSEKDGGVYYLYS
jgi:hypothetical protein